MSHRSEIDPEGLFETPNDPPKTWPEQGGMEFEDVRMSTGLGSGSPRLVVVSVAACC